MSFNLNDAPASNVPTVSTKIYQKPGIAENVKISEVTLGKSSLNSVPYMELTTIGENGEIGKSNRMWLSTQIGKNNDGTLKKTSGWGVTARNIVELIMATHNITEEEAKAIELVPNDAPKETEGDKEMLRNILIKKVASLLVGRQFRAKFKGKQAKPREDGSTGTIFATMDLVESINVPKAESKLRFDPSRDIEMYVDYSSNTNTTINPEINKKDPNDLPF